MDLDDGHGDGGDQKMIKCFAFGKEEREKQKKDHDKGICDRAIFYFALKTP
jgi:hypothetical protein